MNLKIRKKQSLKLKNRNIIARLYLVKSQRTVASRPTTALPLHSTNAVEGILHRIRSNNITNFINLLLGEAKVFSSETSRNEYGLHHLILHFLFFLDQSPRNVHVKPTGKPQRCCDKHLIKYFYFLVHPIVEGRS